MKKRVAFFTVTGLFIISCLYILPQKLYSDKKKSETQPGTHEELYAVITKMTGNVFVQLTDPALNSAAGKRFAAKPGMGLKQGDKITTEKNSRATVVIENGSIFRVEENTSVQIATILAVSDKKTGNIMKSQIDIPKKGFVLSYIRKFAAQKENHISIKTPVCVVAVRGTGLAVDVEDEQTTRVAVFEGRVVVKDFVEESMLPKEGDELLLLFLHEVSMNPNKMTTITKNGIKNPVKLAGKMLDEQQGISELKQDSQEIEESWKNTTLEQRQIARKKIRDEIVTENKAK